MKVKVTQEHINKGLKGSSCYCPIALAIGPNCVVQYSHITIGNKEYRTPQAVFEFLHAFDNGLPVKPFEFELNDS